MNKIIVCRGLPGSGKTTWAKNFVKTSSYYKTVRVNRDDIRRMLSIDYHDFSEIFVKEVEKNIIVTALNSGYLIIVDDTNIYAHSAELIVDACNECNAEQVWVEIKNFFDVPLEVCLARNKQRNKIERVPQEVIRKFAKYYEEHGQLYLDKLRQTIHIEL
jgi:tRNA uridine 5-carbamoylmethylation protein Kti12